MAGFTRLGAGIWAWSPFVDSSSNGRLVILAIYTTASAKLLLPGLYRGGPAALAEDSRMAIADVEAGMKDLLARGVIQWDQRQQVMRLTSLPDAGERPDSWKVLSSWWTRFQVVPACVVRDSHIPLVFELANGFGAAPMTEKMLAFWDRSFGRIPVPGGTPDRVSAPQSTAPYHSGDLGNPIAYPIAYPPDRDQDQDQGSDLPEKRARPVPVAPPRPHLTVVRAAGPAGGPPSPAPASGRKKL